MLEAAAAQRHRQLLRRVNGALHVVTARVEALVSERLQVRGMWGRSGFGAAACGEALRCGACAVWDLLCE